MGSVAYDALGLFIRDRDAGPAVNGFKRLLKRLIDHF
jgi:hypothetical protein